MKEDEDGEDVEPREVPEHLQKMRKCIDNDVPSGSGLYQDFRRKMAHTPEYKKAAATPGYDAMRKLRKKWAELEYEAELKEHTRSEVYEEEEAAEGTYETVDFIIGEEGGSHREENVIAAKNYIKYCLKKGGKWLKQCKRTKRTKILYVKDKLNSRHKIAWGMVERSGKRSRDPSPKAPSPAQGSGQSPPNKQKQGSSCYWCCWWSSC